jgi:hypothetical protein
MTSSWFRWQREADLAALEAELSAVTTEQKRLARAVAMSDEIPELMTELKQRLNRVRSLEAQIAAARRTPSRALRADRRGRGLREGAPRRPRGLLVSPRPHTRQIARRLEAEWARGLQGAEPRKMSRRSSPGVEHR